MDRTCRDDMQGTQAKTAYLPYISKNNMARMLRFAILSQVARPVSPPFCGTRSAAVSLIPDWDTGARCPFPQFTEGCHVKHSSGSVCLFFLLPLVRAHCTTVLREQEQGTRHPLSGGVPRQRRGGSRRSRAPGTHPGPTGHPSEEGKRGLVCPCLCQTVGSSAP